MDSVILENIPNENNRGDVFLVDAAEAIRILKNDVIANGSEWEEEMLIGLWDYLYTRVGSSLAVPLHTQTHKDKFNYVVFDIEEMKNYLINLNSLPNDFYNNN